MGSSVVQVTLGSCLWFRRFSLTKSALSAVVGWAAPNLISRKWTHQITTLLFLGFGLWSLWDAFNDGETEEFEVEKELNANFKIKGGATKEHDKDANDLKKQNRPFLTQFLLPILLKAFSITFFGEWGDKSQLATNSIGLAADENPLGVVLGGILGQALCTTAAVLGGKSLATQISEKVASLFDNYGTFAPIYKKTLLVAFTSKLYIDCRSHSLVEFISSFLESNLFFRPLIHRDFKTKADTNFFYQVKLFH